MKGAQWFDVDLETLRLREVTLNGWPDGMSYKTRMQEECLESVVAFNLDTLFSDEDLLLACTEFGAWKAADVLAVGPFGYLRLMELKKRPTSLGELENQVISYGIDRDRLPAWDVQMAQALTYLPEQVELGLEGFRANQRTQTLGGTYVKKHTSSALTQPWNRQNRFEKAHLVANALRASRGVRSGPPALQNPAVADVVGRVYGIPVAELQLDDPAEAVRQIVNEKWGAGPSVAGTEFTLIAPDLLRRVDAGIPLEERGAHFYLIDAELRHTAGQTGVERAVLRWEPVHRTIPSWRLRTAVALRELLHDAHPEVALFQRDPWGGEFYWNDFPYVYLWIEETADGEWVVTTRFDQLTEGFADLKPRWRAGMRKLREKMPGQSDAIRRSGRDKLSAPWDLGNLHPAAMLFVGYHDMLEEEGFFDLEMYRKFKRP